MIPRALKRYWARRSLPAYTGGKRFDAALDDLNRRLRAREPFALARYGDGEMLVIQGEAIDLLAKANGEHRYQPGDARSERQRVRLAASLTYQHPRYFVGIACPCCVGLTHFQQLKTGSGQAESQLTWANLFVNANFDTFKRDTLSALSALPPVVLVAHERAHTDTLPFDVSCHIKTGANAWVDDCDRVLEALQQELRDNGDTGRTLLFCAGVLSNIAIAELHARYPENTYIDLGSVLDVELGLGQTRKYLRNGRSRGKTCVWA